MTEITVDERITLLEELQKCGTVWYNPHSLANILSLVAVRKNFRVTIQMKSCPLHVTPLWATPISYAQPLMVPK